MIVSWFLRMTVSYITLATMPQSCEASIHLKTFGVSAGFSYACAASAGTGGKLRGAGGIVGTLVLFLIPFPWCCTITANCLAEVKPLPFFFFASHRDILKFVCSSNSASGLRRLVLAVLARI